MHRKRFPFPPGAPVGGFTRFPRPLTLAGMQNAEFELPRLARVYEMFNPWGRSDQFFLDVANETPGTRVLDLGCGTGQLTLRLAEAGHEVTGIEPARASLDVARSKPGAEGVTWMNGLAADAPSNAFDLVLMTSHVAQFMTGDDEWLTVLRHLRLGGRLVFDSRDPAARDWDTWRPEHRTELTLPDGRAAVNWTEVTDVTGECVSFTHHFSFPDSAEELLSHSTLRFRPEATLRETLDAAGFDVDAIYGGWNREGVGQGDGEFIVFSRAR